MNKEVLKTIALFFYRADGEVLQRNFGTTNVLEICETYEPTDLYNKIAQIIRGYNE